MRTPITKFRLEARYLAALKRLAEVYVTEGVVAHPSTANAVRVLIEQECERRGISLAPDPAPSPG